MKGLTLGVAACFCVVAGCGGSAASSNLTGEIGPTRLVANTVGPGPEVPVPKGPPPKELVVVDLKVGSGPEATGEKEITIRYVGVQWNGQVYSNTWNSPRAPKFVLGRRELTMRGLEEGIKGMKVGGRREIVIPPSARFYPDGRPEQLSADQSLVFIVELLAVGDYR